MRRFEAQIGPIADGMESWDHLVEQEGPDAVYLPPEGVPIHLKRVYVVDIFQEGFREVPFLVGDDRVAPTLVKQGLIPCTPVYATVAFTTRTLTAFHAMKMRCPRLGKQAFLRSLNDIHGIAPRPYMQVQFSVAYDVYLRAREEIRIQWLGILVHVLGYDIGCKFEQWVYEHPLVCKLAEEKGFSAVVGAFHITGHLRQCQLRNMPLYRDGMGLEAVENAENIFSKSNALAGTTRHASAFHRRQDIVNYFSHSDNFDALANIVSLIHNKYRRALEVLSKEEDLLDYMNTNNITERSVFEQWLVDEEAALQKLSKEPLEETLQMEYVRKLGDYYACQAKLEALVESIGQEPIPGGRARDFPARMAKWNKQNAERRRTENKLERLATAVEAIEEQLNLRTGQRWKRNSQGVEGSGGAATQETLQRALDRLQYCVVSRLLQLSKTHMVGTSYHMRQHIAKAISSGANALQNALSEYNSAADELGEGHPQLTWEEILEMGVLEDFDLLRLGREDIRDAAWAQPGARVAMDLHFRLLRAQEEIIRCNVEIKQFATWMKEEREFLVYQERRVASEGRHARALQIRKHRMLQGRFFAIHRERLEKLRNMEGFTAVTLDAEPETEIVQAMQQVALEEEQDGGDGTGAQDDEGHEEEEEYAYFAHAALMAWMDEEQVHVDSAE
ncbi:hypothetical protein HMN09_00477600 [Mycena chlorophos]|uniref:CxC1-like cysteine cluster associated with KDZ transposases domain-containing protein n=1 Tax=Mycena chlorophos TaxID=658473 RepID=A0A8H6TIQ0_MYCCL|nr:hypothetical protein HMN09_00477600 [Mycena chlorophos]